MRRVVGILAGVCLSVSFVVVIFMAATTSPASAECPPDPVNPTTGLCLSETIPSTPPTTSPGTPPTSGTNPGGEACPGAPGGVCVNEYGYVWIGPPQRCYGFALDPQPAPESDLWKGNDPAKGTIWSCDPTVSIPGNTWYVPDSEAVINPGQVAQQLVEQAAFETANASIAPPPDYHTYISYKNWLWIPEDQWHDVSVSLTVAGATVTLTAAPTHVNWNRVNCESVSSVGAGLPLVTWMPGSAVSN